MNKEQIVKNFRIIMASNCLVSQAELEEMMRMAIEALEARARDEQDKSLYDSYGNRL